MNKRHYILKDTYRYIPKVKDNFFSYILEKKVKQIERSVYICTDTVHCIHILYLFRTVAHKSSLGFLITF